MPLFYGGTKIQEVIYNGVNLDKVYYGTTLVFARAKIFNGGNGQGIFNISLSYSRGSAVYQNDSTYSNCDISNMTFNTYYGSSGSSYIYGYAEAITSKAYDITQYSNVTFNITSWTDFSGYASYHTCSVRKPSSNQYIDREYFSAGAYNKTETYDQVVSLSNAKSQGNEAKFGWGMELYRFSGTIESWAHGRLNSILLS